MDKTLLPVNATDLERNCEAILARASNLPVEINQIWDPENCPETLLPWLAWALSVDSWDSAWPVSTKRNLIAQSVHIHRTKGTVSAIERVLNTLGITAELTEWFESGGQPHTFNLTAWVNANLIPDEQAILSPAFYQTLKRSIDQVKPVRSHYDFRVGAAFSSDIAIACVAQSISVLRLAVEFI